MAQFPAASSSAFKFWGDFWVGFFVGMGGGSVSQGLFFFNSHSFTPLKFNSEFTPEKLMAGWQTIRPPLGTLCNFSGVNSLLNFRITLTNAFNSGVGIIVSTNTLLFKHKKPAVCRGQVRNASGNDELPLLP